ncbi:hypothetical protein CIW47_14440 [Mycolicibacterium sp. P1-5]|nr:hypothetical protein CIW47_14440 [Mycolicibacterium sp. P1-5]
MLQFAGPEPEPPSRRRWFLPQSRRGKTVVACGVSVLLVAGLLGATYETAPGGTLWGVEKTIFPEHSQDVALAAVVSDLKQAQEILGSGQQPTPDQLTAARDSLNQAKRDLDHLSASPQRTSLQNLYLQLTQQLLQATPESAQQLPPLPAPLPAPPATDSSGSSQSPDVALMDASAPSWGYPITEESATLAPLPGVPDAPLGDWPQPYDPPLTPNLGDVGYYDPSWRQLYGYDAGDWYNYDLSGYNRYGYDFLGFDRWGYDRWGYDRWGYDRWGYNWAGYNWAGYDRDGWDRDGHNDWGQRRDHPGDPRNQDWYNRHHPYVQYYQWKFQDRDPVYRRTLWDQAHGFNRNLYRDWNLNRDWHHPRNRDWAPLPAARAAADVNLHVSSPVVNLNASLTQLISAGKAVDPRPLMHDLADKPAREFTNELNPRITIPIGPQPASTLGKLTLAPPALTAPAPAPAASKVAPGFTTPKLSPAPVYTPPKAVAPPSEPASATRPDPLRVPSPEGSTPRQADPMPPAPDSESDVRSAAPEVHAQEPPDPKVQVPAPEVPARQVPIRRTPAPREQEAAPEQPVKQAPPPHEAPAPAPRPAPEERSAPAPEQHAAPKCSLPAMC